MGEVVGIDFGRKFSCKSVRSCDCHASDLGWRYVVVPHTHLFFIAGGRRMQRGELYGQHGQYRGTSLITNRHPHRTTIRP